MPKAAVTMRLIGAAPLRKALQELGSPSRVRQALRPAIRAGASLVVKDARARLKPHSKTGTLAKSLGVTVVTRKAGRGAGSMYAVIGPRRGQKYWTAIGNDRRGRVRWRKPNLYAHLVEHGTPRARPKPFLNPALRANRRAAEKLIAERFRAEVKRVAAKYRAKGKL